MERLTLTLLIIVSAAIYSDAGNWSVKDVHQETCIILDANITGEMKYDKLDNTTGILKFNVTNGMADGSCNELQQHITISFLLPGMSDSVTWNLTIYFKERKDSSYYLESFDLEAFYNSSVLNVTEEYKKHGMDRHAELEVDAISSEAYKCSDAVLSLAGGSLIHLKNMRVIAYAHMNTTDFTTNQAYELCSLDVRTSDVVPIVVGVCLAVLVIIVMVAYLVGRIRAKRQGYASV